MKTVSFYHSLIPLLAALGRLSLLYLSIIALLAVLIGFSIRGTVGMANAASSWHASSVSAPSVIGEPMKPVTIYWPPCGSAVDC